MSQSSDWAQELRKRAEQLILDRLANLDFPPAVPLAEVKEMFYELQVHQLEVEIQNEELRDTQHTLENLNEHYIKLHNLLPVGILSLDRDGRIVDINQTGARMLGGNIYQFIEQHFTDFITPENQRRFYLHHLHVFDQRHQQNTDLQLQRLDKTTFFAHLESVSISGLKLNEMYCLTVINDTTEHQQYLLAEALRDIAQALTSTLEFSLVLDRVLVNLKRLIPHDAADIMLIEDGVARVVRHQGYETYHTAEMMNSLYMAVDATPIFRRMLESDTPVMLLNVSATPDWVSLPQQDWQKSYLGVSIQIEDKTIGFLNLFSEHTYFFNDMHGELLRLFAKQTALAIQNAQAHDQARQLAILQERHRLARELHDSVTQTLFTSSIFAQSLVRIAKQNPEQAIKQMERIDRLNRGALAEMRILLMELRPDAFAETSLKVKFIYLLDALGGRFETTIKYEIQDEYPPPANVQNTCYRVAQEALNNIIKYAQATAVQLNFRSSPEQVVLSIRDNGVGFHRSRIKAGLGLISMQERADAIGARLHIFSEPGGGTSVSLVWHSEK